MSDIDSPIYPLPQSADHSSQCKIPQKYYIKSSLFGYSRALPNILLFVACTYGVGELALEFKIICGLGIALFGYRLTFVVHDCSHRTLFSRKYENEFFGWLCSSLLLVSFIEYRRLHWIHHTHYCRDLDPQGSDYRDLIPGQNRIIWHLFKPLFFLNLIEKLSKFFALIHCGMTKSEQRIVQKNLNKGSSVRPFSLLIIVITQMVLLFLSTSMLQFLWGYLFFIIPLVTIGLFLSRVRSYLEHGSLTLSHKGELIARTHRSNIFEANILCAIFFHYHNEHHRWPQVPSRLLPRVYEEITAGRLHEYEFSPTYTQSLMQIIKISFGKKNA